MSRSVEELVEQGIPKTYEALRANPPKDVPCYQYPTGCVLADDNDFDCNDGCRMLKAYTSGFEAGATLAMGLK